MYERIPVSCAEVTFDGLVGDDLTIWMTSIYFACSVPVPPGTAALEAAALNAQFVSSVLTHFLIALPPTASLIAVFTKVKDTGGGVGVDANYAFSGAGGGTGTGNELPNAVSALIQKYSAGVGRQHKSRNFIPLGNSAQLDAAHGNLISGTQHTRLTALAMDFVAPYTALAGTWDPCITHPGGTYDVITGSTVDYKVTWRRSRKQGVGR